MADWLYTLPVKQYLNTGADVDHDAVAIEIAPKIAAEVRTLMKRVEAEKAPRVERVGDLYFELDEVTDILGEVATSSDKPQVVLNEALELLYNVGDEGHRVWVK